MNRYIEKVLMTLRGMIAGREIAKYTQVVSNAVLGNGIILD
jgi:hypothetical protein